MPLFVLALKAFSPVLFLVAALHLILGVGAEVMIGAVLPMSAIVEPTLNSQNRFYGVSYALYAVVLWLCAGDLKRFEPIFKAVLWVSLLAGVSRLVAWAQYGAPAPFVVFLLATELLFPPILWLWYSRVQNVA
jgi:Domain of unknown function (DUF4345)